MDFKSGNTRRLNDIKGFCVQVPQATRTVRSVLKGWRYDMRWELSSEGVRELVVWLIEDVQHNADFETGLELWRIPAAEVDPKQGIYAATCVTEQNVDFKIAHLEWALNQALYPMVQSELNKVQRRYDDEWRKLCNDHDREVGKQREEFDHLEERWHKTQQALDLAEQALVMKGTAKQRGEAKVAALEAIKELQQAHTSAVEDVPEDTPFTAYICCFTEDVPEEKVAPVVAAVRSATALGEAAATRCVRKGDRFVVLSDRWEEFAEALRDILPDHSGLSAACVGSRHFAEVKVTAPLGEKKIAAIKAIREYTGLGLIEAKAAAEGTAFRIPEFRKKEFLTEVERLGVDAAAFTFG